MCEHHHEHCHHDSKAQTLTRIFLALIIFTTAFIPNLNETVKIIMFLTAYLICGWDVIFDAAKNIFKGKIFDENFLMTIATTGAICIKEFPEAVMVMLLFQIGEYLQDVAVEKSHKSITQLMDIRPDYANIFNAQGQLIKVKPETVRTGTTIIVKAGEKVPIDGIITEGNAIIDTASLTGESMPVELSCGDTILSGSINTSGLIKIKTTKEFKESTVSQILELVKNAESKKAKTEKFITAFAKYYTPAVVIGAVILAVLPSLLTGGSFELWLQRALTFLVISCPCALVISVPLTFFAGIGAASSNGILIKGSNYIEALSKAKTVIFDKTGTLTKGVFSISHIQASAQYTKDEVLEAAAYAEYFSNHPIAMSIKNAYTNKVQEELIIKQDELAGHGIKAVVNNDEIIAGNTALMENEKINFTPAKENGTVIYIAKNKDFMGYIVISDEIKKEAPEAIKTLKKMNKNTVMLSGDNEKNAKNAANILGIDKVFAQLLPSDKVKHLEDIIHNTAKTETVIFVGDGINDAPVLAEADVGIAMGGLGSDSAIEAADVVIMDDNVSKIALAIDIASKTMKIAKQNIAIALIVKFLFLALGAFGLITMWGAVFADTGVTLLAVLNALRALHIK